MFAIIFAGVFLAHLALRLLNLPYYWDEAGYYTAVARDFLLTGSLIPHTTVSNAHPPLVMVWLALWWKAFGFAPLVTRSAMLVVAAFALLGVFRLAERVASVEVAIAATLCTAVYPVFFAQSSLAQVDLAAAGLICWGLWAYLDARPVSTAVLFSLATLAKETAIIAPAALVGWEIVRWSLRKWNVLENVRPMQASTPSRRIISLLIPFLPLLAWYAYHYARTGYIFGNPEFFRYNVTGTLNLTRFSIALLLRLWQAFGYLHLWILTVGMLLAMLLPPVKDNGAERHRIAIPAQIVFYVIIAAYVVSMALIGGAVLARYMLPAIPLVIIVGVSTLRRRLRVWPAAVAFVAAAFVVAWFWNPPYGFSPEDNLAYRDFVVLHQDAERFLEARYPMARVLTAWPSSNELTTPWLGYVTRPMRVAQIENFSLNNVLGAADLRSQALRSKYDIALVFSTKYEPPHPLLERWKTWEELKVRYFDYHRDLPPQVAARMLGGKIVFSESRTGLWIAVIEMERPEIQEAE